ncbi:MAG: type I methionyl aminopeptidase [Candidatus Omnitrophica bacterium CG1_02_49_16]|nr:MAG: type I methionyl aminopeptidase [Candidatus Omnitrophica bacterium CG1_02_49_16]
MTGIVLKTANELQVMRLAGGILSRLLKLLEQEVKPGVTTKRLDIIAEQMIRDEGGEPAFKGYYGYPASICASVNEEVVHGIPGNRVLKDGDIAGIDVGVRLQDYYSDAARTFAVGSVDEQSRRLINLTREALGLGIDQAVEGHRLSDISWAVQSFAESNGLSVVKQYVGHGIGRSLHEEPQVPNYGKPHEGPKLMEGMALAIEPMLNIGAADVEVLEDGWTVVTKDRKRSGHFEQTIFVGKVQAEIVTE